MKKRLQLKITGRVHGVTFRINAKSLADKLNIFGWVRNNKDGTVSILAEREENDLLQLIKWCQEGPRHAKVKIVDVKKLKYIGDLEEFVILY